MTDSTWMIDREVRCRCGQMGVISGVQGAEERPDFVWVTHPVRLGVETHIHRDRQMSAVMAQLTR